MALLNKDVDSSQTTQFDHDMSLSSSPKVCCWPAHAGLELNALGEGAPAIPVDPAHIVFSEQDELGVTAQKIAAVAFAGAGVVFPPPISAPAPDICNSYATTLLLANCREPGTAHIHKVYCLSQCDNSCLCSSPSNPARCIMAGCMVQVCQRPSTQSCSPSSQR